MASTLNEGGRSVQTPWTSRGYSRNTMNNSLPTNLITQIKQTNSLKDTICQNSHNNKDNIKSCAPMKEIESILNFSKTEVQSPKGSLMNYIEYFKKKLHQFSSNLFQKIEVEEILPSLFSEDSITVLRGPDKFYIYYRPIFLINIDTKFLNPILAA